MFFGFLISFARGKFNIKTCDYLKWMGSTVFVPAGSALLSRGIQQHCQGEGASVVAEILDWGKQPGVPSCAIAWVKMGQT